MLISGTTGHLLDSFHPQANSVLRFAITMACRTWILIQPFLGGVILPVN